MLFGFPSYPGPSGQFGHKEAIFSVPAQFFPCPILAGEDLLRDIPDNILEPADDSHNNDREDKARISNFRKGEKSFVG